MELLYGKPVADDIYKTLRESISTETEKPGLAVILVGQDKPSHIYVNLKEKAAKEIGIEFYKYLLPENVEQEDILKLIELLNADEQVNGIIVQLPLPEKYDTEKIISAIDPVKDVDGFHKENAKLFEQDDERFIPVFPHAIFRLIKSSGENLVNKKAVVVANSKEFGEVMSIMLQRNGLVCEYVLSDSIYSNLGKIGGADVIVSAVGSPGLLKGQMLKDGAIVIDGGIFEDNGKVFGDVDFASTEGKEGFLTPVPGGVGPVTIACLLENVHVAFKAQQKGK